MTEKMKADGTAQSEGRGPAGKKHLPRGRVTIFPNWCKGCNLCVEFCPMGVLEQGNDGRVIVARPEKCTACRWCELHCPDFAIFVSDIEPAGGSGDSRHRRGKRDPVATEEESE